MGKDLQPYYIGVDDREVMLTAYDWNSEEGQVYNWPHLRRDVQKNGRYRLFVERPGRYRLSLSRWPREAQTPIRAGVPAFTPFDSFGPVDDDMMGGLPPGKALDVREARIKIGEHAQIKTVGPLDKECTFTVVLQTGPIQLETWFVDGNGKAFGAYYIEKL